MLQECLFNDLSLNEQFTYNDEIHIKTSNEAKKANAHCKSQGCVIIPFDAVVYIEVESWTTDEDTTY